MQNNNPTSLPPLIPRSVLFGNPERATPQLSPDGRHLAYLAPHDGVLNIWLRNDGTDSDRVITQDHKQGIRQYFWAKDNIHLIYLQDKDGDENWHLYAVRAADSVVRDITPHEDIHAQPLLIEPRFPDRMLVGLNIRDKRLHDVYDISISTGESKLVAENPGNVVEWIADHEMTVRAALSQMEDGGFALSVWDGHQVRELARWSADDGFPECYGFDEHNRLIYVSDARSWNASRLVAIDVDNGTLTVLAEDQEYDLSSIITHPTTHTLQAVSFYKHRPIWRVIDQSIASDFDRAQHYARGDLSILSRTVDDSRWLLAYLRDDGPMEYHLFNRDKETFVFLFTNRPQLETYTLAEMKPCTVRSRDDMSLHGYLSLPPGIEPRHLPLVLNVHGGPWARDTWGFHPEAQWLANRGYACLQINYRGSTGYGKRFLNAGNKEWGAKMHDDLIDAVNWALAQGIADPHRIAIYGGSYGGYAALAGAAFTPDVFRCAISVVGPSSLITLINSIPPYWEPMKKQFLQRVGDPATEEEFLKSRSPLFSADRIVIPMLISQGANDPRVKQAESEQIVDALRSKGKEVDYMLFPNEGHGFARPENRLLFYAEAEKFLARHLGGRAEN